MILSARVIRTPRRYYRCDWCGDLITGEHVYLYGAADAVGEKPWPLRLHLRAPCFHADQQTHPKILAALGRR